MYTIAAVARELGFSTRTVRGWINSGELRAVNLSISRSSQRPRLRIRDTDLESFLQGRSVGGSQSQQASRVRRYKPRKSYV